MPARRGRHLLRPAIALGHNRQLRFIAETATTTTVDHVQAADLPTIPDNVHGSNTVHIDVDIASALPNASILQGGPARMRTLALLLGQKDRGEIGPDQVMKAALQE